MAGGQRQRVPHEGAGEVGDADGGDRVVAILPGAAIQGIHVLALAGDDADGEAATDHLAVAGQVGAHVEVGLGAAGAGTEAGDHLVEDQQGAGFGRDAPQLVQELARLQVGATALNGFDQHGGQVVGVVTHPLQGIGLAVFEDDDVGGGVGHDAGGGRHGTTPGAQTHDHFVEDAVVGTGEDGDALAAGDGAGDAHGAHDGFGAGVAECGTVKAGHFADQFGDGAGQRVLRANLVAEVELATHGIKHEVGLPAEQAHAEAVQGVDVLVAVQIPQVRALGAPDDDLVDHLLQARAEAVDDARVGRVWAVLLRVVARGAGAVDVTLDEGIEPGFLTRGERVVLLAVDAGDGAEGTLRIIGGALVGLGAARGGAGRSGHGWNGRCLGRCSGDRRIGGGDDGLGGRGHGGLARQQAQLVFHQLQLLAEQVRDTVHGARRGERGQQRCLGGHARHGRLQGRRRGRGRKLGRSGDGAVRGGGGHGGIGRQDAVQVLDDGVGAGQVGHQLAEADGRVEVALDLQGQLGEQQGVQPQVDEGAVAVLGSDGDSTDFIDGIGQFLMQSRLAIVRAHGVRVLLEEVRVF